MISGGRHGRAETGLPSLDRRGGSEAGVRIGQARSETALATGVPGHRDRGSASVAAGNRPRLRDDKCRPVDETFKYNETMDRGTSIIRTDGLLRRA